MPTIRSSADLMNHYNEISTFCHNYHEPVFITKNGKVDLAVMSIEAYEELTSRDFYQGTAVDDYLHITLTDEEDILDAIGKLRSIYPNVMKLDYDNKRTREGRVVEAAANADKPPIVLMEELYQLQNNQPMTEQQADFAVKLMEEIWEGSR